MEKSTVRLGEDKWEWLSRSLIIGCFAHLCLRLWLDIKHLILNWINLRQIITPPFFFFFFFQPMKFWLETVTVKNDQQNSSFIRCTSRLVWFFLRICRLTQLQNVSVISFDSVKFQSKSLLTARHGDAQEQRPVLPLPVGGFSTDTDWLWHVKPGKKCLMQWCVCVRVCVSSLAWP